MDLALSWVASVLLARLTVALNVTGLVERHGWTGMRNPRKAWLTLLATWALLLAAVAVAQSLLGGSDWRSLTTDMRVAAILLETIPALGVLYFVGPLALRAASMVASVPTWLWALGLSSVAGVAALEYAPWMGGAAVAVGWLCTELMLARALAKVGWWPAAFVVGACLDDQWSAHRAAGGILAALRALDRGDAGRVGPARAEAGLQEPGRVDAGRRERALRWLQKRAPSGSPLGGTLIAQGMLAAARGDRAGAATWMRDVPELSRAAASPPARRLAAEWLCAYAATEGRWDDVLALSRAADRPGRWRLPPLLHRNHPGAADQPRRWGPFAFGWSDPAASERLRFWGLAAQRVLGGSVSDDALRKVGRRHPAEVERLLRLPAERVEIPERGAGLERALALHLTLRLMPSSCLTEALLQRLGAAWDAVVDSLSEGTRGEVAEDFIALLLASRLPSGEWQQGSALLQQCAWQLQQVLLGEASRLAESLLERVRSGMRLPLTDEWMEWMTVRRAYESAERGGGAESAAMLWPLVHQALNNQAVKLRRPMDHEVFRWLKTEAERQQDHVSLELETRNVRVTTRVGSFSRGRLRPRRWYWVAAAIWLTLRALSAFTGPTAPAPKVQPAVTAVEGAVRHAGYFTADMKRDLFSTTDIRMTDLRPWGIRVRLLLPPDERSVHLRWIVAHPPMRMPDGQVRTTEAGERDTGAGDYVVGWRFRPDMKYEWVPGRWVLSVDADGRRVAKQAFTVR